MESNTPPSSDVYKKPSRTKIFPSSTTKSNSSMSISHSIQKKRKPLVYTFSSSTIPNNITETPMNHKETIKDNEKPQIYKRQRLTRRETSFNTSSIYGSTSISVKTKVVSVLKSIFTTILITLLIVSGISVILSFTWFGVAIYNIEQMIINMRTASAISSSFEIINHLERPKLMSGSLTGLLLTNHTTENDYFQIMSLFGKVIKENFKHDQIGTDLGLSKKDTYIGIYRHSINQTRYLLTATWPNIASSTNINGQNDYMNVYEIKELSPFKIDKNPFVTVPFNYTKFKTLMLPDITPDTKETLKFVKPELQRCLNKSMCHYVLPFVSLPTTMEEGMLVAHVRLSEFSNELAKLLPFQGINADSLLLTRYESYVLADTFQKFYKIPIEKKGERPSIASEHVHTGIRQIAEAAYALYGEKFEELQEGLSLNKVFINSTSYYLDCTLIKTSEIELVHILAIPELSYKIVLIFTGSVILVVSLICVILSIIFACVASYIITKPLKQLVYNLEGLYQVFDLSLVKLDTKPYFTEFRDLHMEFSDLVERLALYRTFLPDHIVQTMDTSINLDIQDTFRFKQGENQRHNFQVRSAFGQYQKKYLTNNIYDVSIDEPPMMVATKNEILTASDSFRSMKSNQQVSHIPVHTLSLGISKENATFICVSIKYKEEKSVNANMATYTKIMNTVAKVATVKSGHIEKFDGEMILLSFNSIAPASNHIVNACLIAMNIAKQINRFPLRGVNGPGGFLFGIGVATGTIFKGNIGSKFKRAWNSLGEPVDSSILCSKHAIVLKLNICIDISIRSKIKRPLFQMRCVDILITRENSQFFVYELKETIVESKTRKNQRWFFDLDKNRSNTPSQQWAYYYRIAFSSLVEDDCEGAMALMKRHIRGNPKDQMALQLLGLIQYILREPLSWPLFLEDFYDRHELTYGTDYVSIIHFVHHPIQEFEPLDTHYHHDESTNDDNSDWSKIQNNYELSSDYSLKLNKSILKAHRMPSRKTENTPIESPVSDSSIEDDLDL